MSVYYLLYLVSTYCYLQVRKVTFICDPIISQQLSSVVLRASLVGRSENPVGQALLKEFLTNFGGQLLRFRRLCDQSIWSLKFHFVGLISSFCWMKINFQLKIKVYIPFHSSVHIATDLSLIQTSIWEMVSGLNGVEFEKCTKLWKVKI